jgi:RNA polymerase sigma-54 factor
MPEGQEETLQDSQEDMDAEGYDDEPEFNYDGFDEDEVPDYKVKEDHVPELPAAGIITQASASSLHDMLSAQVSLLNLEYPLDKVAEQIIGSIDDDGYLRRDTLSIVDDLAFKQNIIVQEKQVEDMIRTIQHFDPPGVCARDVQECLMIQLRRKLLDHPTPPIKTALRILEFHFEEFTRRHFDRIQKSLDISEEILKAAMGEVRKLNPRPRGLADVGNQAEQYIIPDFLVYNNNGEPELTLNQRNAPDLRVSAEYKDMLKEYERGSKKDKRQKEAVTFIKQKIDAAKWFIDAIIQRQQTLLLTMNAIIEHQRPFFLSGDETSLRPMILKDIAEKTGLDISTISRVANSKFVQTEFGSFRLKFFFSESLSTESGEEVSTREVKSILNSMIEGEDKRNPLSDDTLTEMLQDKGYNIARRTVAKYRELLNIPVARLRKEL